MPSAQQVSARFTCNNRPLLSFSSTVVTVSPRPVLTLRPAKQPPPGCLGKPAVGVFRYTLKGLAACQDFNLTAAVGQNCTAKLTPSKRERGCWAVTQALACCRVQLLQLASAIVKGRLQPRRHMTSTLSSNSKPGVSLEREWTLLLLLSWFYLCITSILTAAAAGCVTRLLPQSLPRPTAWPASPAAVSSRQASLWKWA
jgi:hypothetical protein